ncbi:PPOX class F420-dependent oxidoreductase [Saccharopolyspora gregorii]|uniref:TIGR03618 family F420-dependent PPOX class oxidoreductase n=1 Tax=Saccharopolyspora gregorii TaxID=33914 RepID=A0ABP6RZT6_9PSEU
MSITDGEGTSPGRFADRGTRARGATVGATTTTGEDEMDLDRARSFLREHHRAVLGTLRADGTPQLVPVLVAVDDRGRALISTRDGSAKVRNLRRDPRAWICALPDEFFGEWIQVDGAVEVVEQPAALPLLEDYYRRVAGEHEDWSAYRRAMAEERRVLLRIELERAGPSRR